MKKLKRKLLTALFYTTMWGMWTSLIILGFNSMTVYR